MDDNSKYIAYEYNLEGALKFLSAFLSWKGMEQSRKALGYANRKHRGQKRKGGEPYLSHPVSMVCRAIASGVYDDDMLAVILLHDVCEDTNTEVEELPFNHIVRTGVKYMTIEPLPGETKVETKKRYFMELASCKEGLLCKAVDRYSNLLTMQGRLEDASIRKNILETHWLLLNSLRSGEDKWPELSNLLNGWKGRLKDLNGVLAYAYKVDLDDLTQVIYPEKLARRRGGKAEPSEPAVTVEELISTNRGFFNQGGDLDRLMPSGVVMEKSRMTLVESVVRNAASEVLQPEEIDAMLAVFAVK